MFQVNEEEMKPAPSLTSDEGLPDPHPPTDVGILLEDSSSTESEMEFHP